MKTIKMIKEKITKSLFILSSIIFSFACEKEKDHAIESLIGNWAITAISTQYGQYNNQGQFEQDSTSITEGQLGTINFKNQDVSYKFSNNNKAYSAIAQWNLTYERVKEGFTGRDQYTLIIKDHFVFDVRFGDQTKNSEKNASKATFQESLKKTVGVDSIMNLTLEKQ